MITESDKYHIDKTPLTSCKTLFFFSLGLSLFARPSSVVMVFELKQKKGVKFTVNRGIQKELGGFCTSPMLCDSFFAEKIVYACTGQESTRTAGITKIQ